MGSRARKTEIYSTGTDRRPLLIAVAVVFVSVR